MALKPSELERKSGYGQSKAVAEALLFAAAERHRLDIRIVRPSAISGHRISGYANQHDATTLLLSAMVSLGAAPDSSSLPLRWIPVDFVATAVIRLALAPAATVAGRAYNLMSSSPSLADAVVALKAEGFVLRAVPATDWPNELSRLLPTHAAAPLVESFARMDVGQDSRTEDDSALLPIFSARATLAELGVPWPACAGLDDVRRTLQWLVANSHGLF